MTQKFKKIKSTLVYKGRVAKVYSQEVSFNISRDITYEIIKRPPIVLIVPVTNEGKLILLKQYRAPLNKYIWEFPAGHIKSKEDEKAAVLRELEEETGKKAKDVKFLYSFQVAPHFCDERVNIFIAKRLLKGNFMPSKKEIIYEFEFTIDEIKNMISHGDIEDAKTLIAFQAYLRSKKDENK